MTLVYVDNNGHDEATTKQKQKEYHLKRLKELSEKSLGEIPQLDELTEEQKQWVNRRMKDSATSWEIWDR